MKYLVSKQFEKDFAKLPKSTKLKVIAAFQKFVINHSDTSLRNHKLSGTLQKHYSINVTGDVRAVYVLVEPDIAQFVAIGTHSELYG